MEPIAKTLTLNNTVMVGKGNSSFYDSSDNACFGINNIVPRTSVFVGLDNIAYRSGQETRYSVLVGSNNQINNRCFVFGRDNSNIGERDAGFTSPIMIMGSGNVFSCPKDPCLVLGYDTVDTSHNIDGLSGCIVVGGGNRPYFPNCAYYGKANSTERTFMEGIAGYGENLCIDTSTNELTRKNAITIYKDDNTASKTLSYDYIHAIEQNSNAAFSNYNNDPDFNRYNIVYNSTTNTYGRSTLPVVSRASVRITGPIDWNNITALPITSSNRPISCGKYGDSIIISLVTTSEGADIPLNQTMFFTIAVKADPNIGSFLPCYKLNCGIKDQVYTSSSIAFPKFKESMEVSAKHRFLLLLSTIPE
jgi:hypothetical protein